MGSFINAAGEAENEELYQAFVAAHDSRLRDFAIPQCKWRILCKKLSFSIFDAGDSFVYLPDESLDDSSDTESQQHLHVYTKCVMNPDDTEHIYLIDHAWTYTLQSAKRTLEENPQLANRMAAIMEISDSSLSNNDLVSEILNKIWLYNNCYAVQGENPGTILSCWYILDEFGSRIHYSDDPSFVIVPFFFAGDNSVYSLLFPKRNVSEGEEVTVKYPGYSTSLPEVQKKALKYPWSPCDLSDVDFSLSEPSVDYFASGRFEDILPHEFVKPEEPVEGELLVYSDYSDVIQFLTHPAFRIVGEKDKANIFWLAVREYNIRELIEQYPHFYYISQFPSEQVLINKDLLAVICRRYENTIFDFDTLKSYPEWLPTTYNLKTELSKFVSYFQNRGNRSLNNVWICKPFNLARGMDIYITDNVAEIIRLSQSRSMVASKYITDPVLFPIEEKGLVKMDLRYIVLLRCADPLEVYVYDRFWIRFANKAYALEDFNEYERHFTVMNYSDFPLQQMYCHDFIKKFEDHYSSYKWRNIEKRIYEMIKAIFVASTMKEPPAGIGKFSGARAIYGLDIMLKWDRNHAVPEMKPMILEVNWMPDCKRACKYYPEFYNDIFSVLFLGDTDGKHVVKL